MSDILFLENHPAWTWTDLMATPDKIVAGLRMLDQEKVKNAKLQ